jgi:dolichyl-phosphate-mannose--protein O-mannosyl transferase
MAITKEEYLNRLEINVQSPQLEVVRRVSFMEDGVELNRTHVSTNYNLKNEHLIVSESQLVQDIWALVSGSEFVL